MVLVPIYFPLHNRKQSLASQNVNPFVVITKKLEQLPIDMNSISREDIAALTDPLIGSGTPEEIMSLAKTASRTLYVDLEAAERVKCINDLVMIKLNFNFYYFLSFVIDLFPPMGKTMTVN